MSNRFPWDADDTDSGTTLRTNGLERLLEDLEEAEKV